MVHMLFSWAEENNLVGENPAQKVSKPKKEKKEKAFFKTEEDLEKVLRAIDQHQEKREDRPGPTPDVQWLKEMILVAVGTGLRRGELLNLRWRDVDLDSGRLKVRSREDFTPKNRHERTVPFCGDALDTLREMRDERNPDSTDPVFVDSDGHPISARHPVWVSKKFKEYVRRTDLSYREELSFHSTRHTTASWLVMEGVSLFVVKEILGHENIETTMVYSHLRPDVMGGAMEEAFGS
jgi:integrase